MSNRRVKSLALDEDDYDDYDEYDDDYQEGGDDELSPEDREQMRQGTIKVREALGPAFPVSDKDVQEALWHYYYDIGKSVAYLKSMCSITFVAFTHILTSIRSTKARSSSHKETDE